jgi:fatty acid desaturase
MSGLVSGLFDDVRHAVGARVDGIRKDVDDRLDVLASRLTSMLTAMAIITVTATFCGLAIAASLFAFGVPLWASLWGVTLTAAALVVVGAYRRRKQRASAAPATALETTAADSAPLGPD